MKKCEIKEGSYTLTVRLGNGSVCGKETQSPPPYPYISENLSRFI